MTPATPVLLDVLLNVVSPSSPLPFLDVLSAPGPFPLLLKLEQALLDVQVVVVIGETPCAVLTAAAGNMTATDAPIAAAPTIMYKKPCPRKRWTSCIPSSS